MAEYRKYLFDNFVISSKKKEEPVADVVTEDNANEDDSEELPTEEIAEVENAPETEQNVETPEVVYEEVPTEVTYTQDELDEAVQKAKNEGYTQGLMASQEQETAKQNELLSEIGNRLGVMFADMDKQSETEELTMLRFLVSSLHKLMPTLESVQAVEEIKKFLEDNFSIVGAQKSLAFFFAPDTVKKAAPLLERVAAQNDFEGKISVHKDENLGASDCRIEWKDGHIERNVNKLLDKFDEMLSNNQQERENG